MGSPNGDWECSLCPFLCLSRSVCVQTFFHGSHCFVECLTLLFILKMSKTSLARAWCVRTGEECERTESAFGPWLSAVLVNSSELDYVGLPQPCGSGLPAFSSGWPVGWHCDRKWTLTIADFIGVFSSCSILFFSAFLRIMGSAPICQFICFDRTLIFLCCSKYWFWETCSNSMGSRHLRMAVASHADFWPLCEEHHS